MLFVAAAVGAATAATGNEERKRLSPAHESIRMISFYFG